VGTGNQRKGRTRKEGRRNDKGGDTTKLDRLEEGILSRILYIVCTVAPNNTSELRYRTMLAS
jgi:hypothetical protein